jgi:hypothetical protein
MAVTTIPTAGIADNAVTIAKATGFGKVLQVVSFESSFVQNLNTTSQTDMQVSSGVISFQWLV